MRNFYLIVCSFIISAISIKAIAQTEVAGGTLSESTTWTLSGSPYNINGDILVSDGSTLTIEQGVQVVMQGNYYIRIEGNLRAIGSASENEHIAFTKASSVSGWKGIEIESSATNDSTILRYVWVIMSSASGVSVNSTDKIEISYCLFKYNEGSSGAGIYTNNSSFTIANNTFKGNEAVSYDGGGLYCINGDLLIVNNFFIDNTASRYGAALYSNNSNVELINNTFVYNQAGYGGAAFFYNNSIINSYNNIFWKNVVSLDGQNIYYHSSSQGNHSNDAFQNGSSSIYLYNSTVNYNGGNFDATCINLNSNNTTSNGPNFISPTYNDYTLNPFSILVDNGDTTGISQFLTPYDLEGEKRVSDNNIDIGAHEINLQEISGIVTATAQGNGSISPVGDSVVYYLDTAIYVITPNDNELLLSAKLNGSNIMGELIDNGDYYSYYLDSVHQNSTLEVVFTEPYIVHTEVVGNGTISPSKDSTITYLDTIMYTFTPGEGEEFVSAIFNGEVIEDNELFDNGDILLYYLDSVFGDATLKVNFTQSYIITSIAGENGSISPEGNRYVESSETVVYTITPEDGYTIENATYKGNSIIDQLESHDGYYTYELSSVTSAGTVEITFRELIPYTVTASSGVHGTISPTGDVATKESYSQTFDFTPDNGYVVSKVLIDNKEVAFAGDSYTINDIEANKTIHVEFEKFKGKFSYYPDDDAYIRKKELNPAYSNNNFGESNTLLLLDSEFSARDYIDVLLHFSEIDKALDKFGIADFDTIESIQLKMCYYSPSSSSHVGNNNFNAYWYDEEWDEDTVTWNNAPAISDINLYTSVPASTSGTQDYSIDIKELFIEQYESDNGTAGFRLKLSNGIAGQRQQVTLASKENENIELWPELVIKLKGVYNIEAITTGGGTIMPAGDTLVYKGDTVNYTITPDAGEQLIAANYNGVNILESLINHGSYYTYSLDSIIEEGKLDITFTKHHTINSSATEGGSINPIGDSTVLAGSSIMYTITPDEGYGLVSVTFNEKNILDSIVDQGNYYTYNYCNIDEGGDLIFEFSKLYTVNSSSTGWGSILPEGDTNITVVDTVIYTIVPDIGQHIVSARYNDESVMDDLIENEGNYSYHLSGVDEAGSLVITFSELVTITASAKEGGTVSPSGESVVNAGETIIYTITPEAGKQIESAKLNGASILTDLVDGDNYYTYTLVNTNENSNLIFTFTEKQYTITVVNPEGGYITPGGEKIYTVGDSVQYIISPDYNKQIETATFNDVSIINDLIDMDDYYIYQIDSVAEDGVIKFTFTDLTNSVNSITKSKLEIHPNPTTGIVHIKLETGTNNTSICIYNTTGEMVYKEDNFNGKPLDLSALQPGMYVVKINSGGKIFLDKLIKK